MAIHEPGRPYRCALDVTDSYYALSEAAEYELRVLVEALRATSMLCDELGQHISDFGPRDAAALFHVFAERGADLLGKTSARLPSGTPAA